MPAKNSVADATSSWLKNSTQPGERGKISGINTAEIGTAMASSGENRPLSMLTPTAPKNRTLRSMASAAFGPGRQPELVEHHEQHDAQHDDPERRGRRHEHRGDRRGREVGHRTHDPLGQPAEGTEDVVAAVGRQEEAEHQ